MPMCHGFHWSNMPNKSRCLFQFPMSLRHLPKHSKSTRPNSSLSLINSTPFDLCFSFKVNGYQCNCLPGFTGPQCTELVNKCQTQNQTSTCLNGGTCLNLFNSSFHCICPLGNSFSFRFSLDFYLSLNHERHFFFIRL